MATPPERVRNGLTLITAASIAEVRAAAATESDTAAQRALLLAATPLIVESFTEGSAALAFDWFEEMREEARAPHRFAPEPVVNVAADILTSQVAQATRGMWLLIDGQIEAAATELAKVIEIDAKRITEEVLREAASEVALARLEPIVQKEVAAGFRDTIRENVRRDPDAAGWRRHTRGASSCRFCRMLAAKGAIYRKHTAPFAAHERCHCVAVPVWSDGTEGPEASAEQYLASQRKRTPAEKKALREYLDKHYPAPVKPVDLDAVAL